MKEDKERSLVKKVEVGGYEHILNLLKAKDSLVDSYALRQDRTLARLVHSWDKIQVIWKPPTVEMFDPDKDVNVVWDEMWEYCDWDEQDISIAIGVPEDQVLLKHLQARKLKLIFPDGTIRDSSRRLLDMELKSEINPNKIEFLMQNSQKGESSGSGGYDA